MRRGRTQSRTPVLTINCPYEIGDDDCDAEIRCTVDEEDVVEFENPDACPHLRAYLSLSPSAHEKALLEADPQCHRLIKRAFQAAADHAEALWLDAQERRYDSWRDR